MQRRDISSQQSVCKKTQYIATPTFSTQTKRSCCCSFSQHHRQGARLPSSCQGQPATCLRRPSAGVARSRRRSGHLPQPPRHYPFRDQCRWLYIRSCQGFAGVLGNSSGAMVLLVHPGAGCDGGLPTQAYVGRGRGMPRNESSVMAMAKGASCCCTGYLRQQRKKKNQRYQEGPGKNVHKSLATKWIPPQSPIYSSARIMTQQPT